MSKFIELDANNFADADLIYRLYYNDNKTFIYLNLYACDTGDIVVRRIGIPGNHVQRIMNLIKELPETTPTARPIKI